MDSRSGGSCRPRGGAPWGPSLFLDHMGPVDLAPGDGIDVPPHPHIHLATITYLFEGEIHHRDSLGSHQAIEPGAINSMTVGRGIVHSARRCRGRAGRRSRPDPGGGRLRGPLPGRDPVGDPVRSPGARPRGRRSPCRRSPNERATRWRARFAAGTRRSRPPPWPFSGKAGTGWRPDPGVRPWSRSGALRSTVPGRCGGPSCRATGPGSSRRSETGPRDAFPECRETRTSGSRFPGPDRPPARIARSDGGPPRRAALRAMRRGASLTRNRSEALHGLRVVVDPVADAEADQRGHGHHQPRHAGDPRWRGC